MNNANQQTLYTHVARLTGILPARNHANLQSLEMAAAYITGCLRAAGASPTEQLWQAGGHTYKNIIVTYRPELPQRLIVGAHYDVCGNQPGADDNASAVAGLLELARLVFANKPETPYAIDFVAYCLEEPPYFATNSMGSYVHAASLHQSRADVLGMICLEMIGYFSDAPNSQPYPSPELAALYPSTANFIIVVGLEEHADFNRKVHALMREHSNIDVQVISFANANGLAGLSDHRNYWQFGYPALMINDTSFIRNPNYHQPTDTIDTLDFAKMKAVVDAAYNAIVQMGGKGV